MTTTTFDTLAFAKRLMEAGFTERQAEAQVTVLREIVESELATKRDLRELELRLTAEMVKVNAETKADILKWVAGMLVAQAALIAALVKLL
ncbi:DUF1640 domain-containing protein [Desulfolutivibrio sulfoxidireducens]|uniref:DUF1640 domain-containing protein n=1 Tax=Desulfolutivibrio sulfoxidireducens TaxID=2773299 RepID=UPI00159E08B5|nr:DUF1640 domain-containing protein [Desulfolutivibrio sulfoxidireducens]QLA16684.1 DUF1640 domain-containing protein [Desulfolutivibrio sulfoxidireducens]QLA19439.1 DUF1640 domain-containing protein [Desulfolutivibrio sulfoxidireducens]